MNLVALKTGFREINYLKLIYYIGVIGIVIVGSYLTASNVIQINSLMITVLLFCLLPLLFIAGLEKLFLLLIISAFIPFVFTFGGVEGWEIKDFFTPVLLFLLIGRCAVKGELLNRVPRISIPLLLFLCINLAHILTLEDLSEIVKKFLSFGIPAGGYRIFYNLFIYGIVCFLAPLVFKKESDTGLLVKLLGGACIFLILFSFMRLYLGIDTLYSNEPLRSRIAYTPAGEYIVPRVGIMGVAGYLLFVIALIFVKPRSNILFVLLTALSLAGIIQSGGRAALLGLMFAIGFYLYLTGKKASAAIVTIGPLLVLMFVGLNPKITSKLPPVFYRHFTVFSSANPSLSYHENTRLEMWSITSEIISKHPFWGARSIDYKRAYHEEALSNVVRGGAHNAYLSTAASLGLPALVLWLVTAASYFRKIIYLYKKTQSFALLNRFCLWLAVTLGVSFLTLFLEGGVGGGFKYFLSLGLIDSAWNMYCKNQRPIGV